MYLYTTCVDPGVPGPLRVRSTARGERVPVGAMLAGTEQEAATVFGQRTRRLERNERGMGNSSISTYTLTHLYIYIYI